MMVMHRLMLNVVATFVHSVLLTPNTKKYFTKLNDGVSNWLLFEAIIFNNEENVCHRHTR